MKGSSFPSTGQKAIDTGMWTVDGGCANMFKILDAADHNDYSKWLRMGQLILE